ncbi:MAG: SpoIVB peptidase S55 domain-containing protein [Acidobacteriota bacterium]|nr:SpoIVB peptidase S55 domain-containing protein [Acidobacteriota bacterium]
MTEIKGTRYTDWDIEKDSFPMIYPRLLVFLAWFFVGGVSMVAQPVGFFPLDQIQPGQEGYGKTVFQGTKVERFGVEILGVLRNVEPKRNMILARLSGKMVEKTGVFAGMSGSPVYLEDQLVGAVAFTFTFITEPIVGITPIHEMINTFSENPRGRAENVRPFSPYHLYEMANLSEIPEGSKPSLSPMDIPLMGQLNLGRLQPIAVPLSLSGFNAGTIKEFASELNLMGWMPAQGMGTPQLGQSDDALFQAGSTISVQLVRGDADVSASGTVTHVSGNKVYAFGHPFLSIGYTDLPLAKASVLTIIPSLMTSQKISATGELIGSVKQDRATGIMGVMGEEPKLVPLGLRLRTSRNELKQFNFELARDRFLTPFLMTLILQNSIIASERSIGDQTLQMKSTISIVGQEDVSFENVISDQLSTPILAAMMAVSPLKFLLNSGFDDIEVEKVNVEITVEERIQQTILEKVWHDRVEVDPGKEINLTFFLRQSSGETIVKKYPVKIPEEMSPGPLKVIIADGISLEALDAQADGGTFIPQNLEQLIEAINNLKRNNRLYIRLVRDRSGAMVEGEDMTNLPPSLLALYSSEKTMGEIRPLSQVVYVEHEIPGIDLVLQGRKEITVRVK